MKLMSIEAWQAKRRSSDKKNQKQMQSKKVEYRLELELQEKLSQLLEKNDRVLLEVNPQVVGEFLNILNDKLLTMYDYEQVDKNKYIFYNKEFEL